MDIRICIDRFIIRTVKLYKLETDCAVEIADSPLSQEMLDSSVS